MKTALTYEHIVPETVGNMRRVLISDLSGRSNVLFKVKELGVELDESSAAVQKIVDEIKEMEHYGYSYEDAEGSFELMVKRHTGEMKHFFDLERFKVSIQKDHLEKTPVRKLLLRYVLATKRKSPPPKAMDLSMHSIRRCGRLLKNFIQN